MVEVPLIDTPNQELAIELENQDCTIQVRQLADYIYLTLWVDSTLICENAICMPLVPIVQNSQSLFSGNFLIVDSSAKADKQSLPDYTELGTRYLLVYGTDEELVQYVNN